MFAKHLGHLGGVGSALNTTPVSQGEVSFQEARSGRARNNSPAQVFVISGTVEMNGLPGSIAYRRVSAIA